MKYYLLFFTGIYTVAIILFGIFATIFDLTSSITTVPTLILAGFLTAWQFVKREQRIPTPEEKKKLIWSSIASTFVVSTVLAAIVLPATMSIQDIMNALKAIPSWIWLVIFGFLILIEYAVFHYSYSGYAKTCLKSLENKKRLN